MLFHVWMWSESVLYFLKGFGSGYRPQSSSGINQNESESKTVRKKMIFFKGLLCQVQRSSLSENDHLPNFYGKTEIWLLEWQWIHMPFSLQWIKSYLAAQPMRLAGHERPVLSTCVRFWSWRAFVHLFTFCYEVIIKIKKICSTIPCWASSARYVMVTVIEFCLFFYFFIFLLLLWMFVNELLLGVFCLKSFFPLFDSC